MNDPILTFKSWLEEAKICKAIAEPTAMCLATADNQAQPSARIVLLKEIDSGFVFYTNMGSHKSADLQNNPQAALCFHWMPLDRQVRIEGRVEKVSDAQADAYFTTRPRESQIGAWSSKQSQPLPIREALVQAVADNTKKYEGAPVPRPPFWSGWRVVPEMIEFWQQGTARLHDREVYRRIGAGWNLTRLYP